MICPTGRGKDYIDERIDAIPQDIDFYETLSKKSKDPVKWMDVLRSLWTLEEYVFGGRTPELSDFLQGKGPSPYQHRVRELVGKAQDLLGDALTQSNPWIRNLANLLLGFNRNIGKSYAEYEKVQSYFGMQDYAEMASAHIQEMARRIAGNDRNRLVRVWAYLDPELSGGGVSWDDLDPRERKLVNLVRLVSDFVNDMSYYLGGISRTKWEENKGGKYIPRSYDVFEFPEEVKEYFRKSGFKLELGPWQERGEITDWKKAHKITDPIYLITNVMQQIVRNREVLRMADWLTSNDVVSMHDDADPNTHVRVPQSESYRFGPLTGRWIDRGVYDRINNMWDTVATQYKGQPVRRREEERRIRDFINDLAETPYVSLRQRPGFKKLSSDPRWGALAGKWVRTDVLDQLIGFHFNSWVMDGLYHLINRYDQLGTRRFLKETKVTMNFAVRLGNKFSNFLFSVFSGINPIQFIKNRSWAKTQIKQKGDIYRLALKEGLLGFDTTFGQLSKYVDEITRGISPTKDKTLWDKIKAPLDKIRAELRRSYAQEDDIAKLAAFKTLLDGGFSVEEAKRRVFEGYQNYRNAGFLYDIGAKIPFLGNPFVRFQGELLRIMSNNVALHPIATLSTLMAFKFFQYVGSRLSGETEEERKVREKRLGIPHLPFIHPIVNYPLVIQTPWGEVNAARLIGLYAYQGLEENVLISDVGRIMPFLPPHAKNIGSDPVIGPLIATFVTDTDFRGKSIKDPDMDRIRGSLLTLNEQRWNQFMYLVRQYGGPNANAALDILSAMRGEETFFGKVLTPLQATLRTYPGIKIEQFGPEEVRKYKDRLEDVLVTRVNAIQSKISTITKQWDLGEIDTDTAVKRIKFFSKGLEDIKKDFPEDMPIMPIIRFYEDYNKALIDYNLWKLSKKAKVKSPVGREVVPRFTRLERKRKKLFSLTRRARNLRRLRESKEGSEAERYNRLIERIENLIGRYLEEYEQKK